MVSGKERGMGMGRGTKKELLLYLLDCTLFKTFLSKCGIINIPITQSTNTVFLFSVISPMSN